MVYIRFFRRIRLSRRFSLNISKNGVSLTFFNKIVRITLGKHGIRFSTGLKGSGLSITEYVKYKK